MTDKQFNTLLTVISGGFCSLFHALDLIIAEENLWKAGVIKENFILMVKKETDAKK